MFEDFADSGFRSRGRAGQNLGQFIGCRVPDQNFEKEAVQLRFGKRISSFLVNGILGGHDKEWLGQLPNFTACRNLVFLHGFEQGGLGFGRCAVDFVRENEVGENGSALELEFAPPAGSFHHNIGAQNIRRHEIRRELNAVERKVEHLAERPDEQGLAEAGHALEQDMASGEKRDHCTLDDLVLADEHFGDFGAERGVGVSELSDGGFSGHKNLIEWEV